MKRRNFLQLMAALAGVGFLPKAAAKIAPPPPPAIPVGTIQAFAGTQLPPGWLPCDGRHLSPGRYPELYQVIGRNNPFSPTFQLPNLNAHVLMHAVPDNSAFPDLCGWHGEALNQIQHIVKAKS
jgi:microcystin-dependent protein